MKWFNNLIFVTNSVTIITFQELSIQYARIYIMSWKETQLVFGKEQIKGKCSYSMGANSRNVTDDT